MAKIKFKHDFDGYLKVMNSPNMQLALEKKADLVKTLTNNQLSREGYTSINGFETFSSTLPDGRNVAGVYTHSLHAMRSQNKRKTLTKALNAAKG